MAVSNESSNSALTVFALLLIILGIVGIFLFLIPKKADFDENSAFFVQKQNEIAGLKNQLADFRRVEAEFEGSEVTKMEILSMIPDSVNQDGIIRSLSDTANKNDVLINSVSFGTRAGRDVDSQVATINLNVTGTHANLIKFIEEIENSRRKFRINTISLQMLEARLENMSITLEAFYL